MPSVRNVAGVAAHWREGLGQVFLSGTCVGKNNKIFRQSGMSGVKKPIFFKSSIFIDMPTNFAVN